jgi:hypothetical protein
MAQPFRQRRAALPAIDGRIIFRDERRVIIALRLPTNDIDFAADRRSADLIHRLRQRRRALPMTVRTVLGERQVNESQDDRRGQRQ